MFVPWFASPPPSYQFCTLTLVFKQNYCYLILFILWLGSVKTNSGLSAAAQTDVQFQQFPTQLVFIGQVRLRHFLGRALRLEGRGQDRQGGRALRPHDQLYPCVTYEIHVQNKYEGGGASPKIVLQEITGYSMSDKKICTAIKKIYIVNQFLDNIFLKNRF